MYNTRARKGTSIHLLSVCLCLCLCVVCVSDRPPLTQSSSAGFRQRCVVRVKKFYARLKESARKHHGKSADRAGIRRACTHVAAAAERLVAALYPGAPFQVRAKFRVSVCVCL